MAAMEPVVHGELGAARSNPLGLAGFICSLLGVVTAGVLTPVGLILSLVALGREPRGFAIAGVVIGVIGLCGWVIVIAMVGVGVLLAAVGIVVAVALSDTQRLELTTDMATMAVAIKQYEREHRYLPAQLTDLNIEPAALRDPWGNTYEYHLQDEPPGFEIVSLGEDATVGTDDDMKLSELGKEWKPGGMGVSVREDEDQDRVTIDFGSGRLDITGDETGGHVQLDFGDRTVEIVGAAEAGTSTGTGAGTGADADADADADPDADTDADADAGADPDADADPDGGDPPGVRP